MSELAAAVWSALELFGLLVVITILAWLAVKSWYFRDSPSPRLARIAVTRFKSGW